MGQARDDSILVTFWITVLDANHNMWRKKLLDGGPHFQSAFLVALFFAALCWLFVSIGEI